MTVLERLNSIVDVYVDILLENRYMPLFVLNEMNQNPERFVCLLQEHVIIHMKSLFEQIQEEVHLGKIKQVHPAHLLLHVLGLIIFPFAAYPLITKIAQEEFKPFLMNFLNDRKKTVKQFITDALTP